MNFKRLLVAAAALVSAVAIVSCKKDSTPSEADPKISLDKTSLTFAVKGDPQTVKLTSNRDWTVQKDDAASWVTITPAKGVAGETTVTVAVDANEGDERDAELIFTTGSASMKLNVSQEAAISVDYATVESIRALATASGAKVPDNTIVLVQVTSNNAVMNNLTSSKICYVQDVKHLGPNTGMQIYFAANHSFIFGNTIKVDLSGQTVKLYNGTVEIDGCPIDKATVKSSDTEIEPKAVSEADFLAGKYEGQFITVNEPVQVASTDLEKNWAASGSHTSISMEFADGGKFAVFSSKYATSLQSVKVAQGSGKIIGTAGINNGIIQLYFTSNTDYAALTGERFKTETKTITIDEALTHTNGTYSVNGRVIATSTAGFVINDGTQNNMYVALPNATVKVNDIVTVTGSLTKYGCGIRFSDKDAAVAPCTATIPATPAQSVTVVTPDQIQAATYDSKGSAAHISFSGVLSTSESNGVKYYNLAIPGVEKPVGSVYTSQDLTSFVDQSIKVTGYYAGHSSNYFMIVADQVEPDAGKFFTVSPASAKMSADGGSVTFKVSASSDVAWTVAPSDAFVSVNVASGTGNGEVVATVEKNTATTMRQITVLFSTTADVATKSYEVKIVQAAAADPSLTYVELTNDEIVAAVKAAKAASSKNGYQTYSIESQSGTWVVFGNVSITNEGVVSTPYIQINGKNGYYAQSPVFSANIDKVELTLNSATTKDKLIHLIPSSTELPTASANYSDAVYANSYGFATPVGNAEVVTITPNADIKDFKIVTKGGAGYIESIKIYLKK